MCIYLFRNPYCVLLPASLLRLKKYNDQNVSTKINYSINYQPIFEEYKIKNIDRNKYKYIMNLYDKKYGIIHITPIDRMIGKLF